MACRSAEKCNNAANSINAELASSKSKGSVTPELIDLADLNSVKSFASKLEGKRVNVLFNNAGYVPVPNTPANEYGLDPSFSSMHLAHFLLTEELLRKNPDMRVVNTSSGTHHLCAIPFSYAPPYILGKISPNGAIGVYLKIKGVYELPRNPGCVTGDYLSEGIRSPTSGASYIQAKLANVMHAVATPRRHPRASAVVIDLGWVGTNIQPFLRLASNLGWTRSAKVGVLPAMHAILTSNAELTNELNEGKMDRIWGGFVVNVFGMPEQAFSYHWWKNGANANLSRGQMIKWSEKLWDESAKLLEIKTSRRIGSTEV